MNEMTLSPLALERKEYDDKPVVTLRDIDRIHKRPDGSARRNFNQNKRHFIEGVDYFVRNSYEALSEFGIEAPNGLRLLTMTGYLMIVKSFTDDLSWAIQRELVTGYFSGKRGRRFMGSEVLTLSDYARLTGEKAETASDRLRRRIDEFPMGEALYAEGANLKKYKAQNPEARTPCKGLWLLTANGAKRLYGMKK